MIKTSSKYPFHIVSSLILLLLFIELVFPPITTLLKSSVVCFACLILWLALSALNDLKYYLHIKPFVLSSVLFFLFTVIIPYICGSAVIAHRYIDMAMIPFGYVIYDYYKEHDCKQDLIKIIGVSGVFAIITAITTYIALLDEAYISRKADGKEQTADLQAMGIGGYSFVYLVAAAAPIFLYIFLKTKSKRVKAATLIAFVFSLVFISKSNYLTAFLAVIIVSAVLLLGYILTRKKRKFVYSALLIIFTVLFITSFDTILGLAKDMLPQRIVQGLFTEDSVAKSIWQEFTGDRLPMLLKSIEAFVKHPLFGNLGDGAIEMSGGFLLGFGQHSHILDTFALYGIIIGVWSVVILVHPFRKNGKWVKSDIYFSVAMILSAFIIYMFNIATNSIALVYTIIFPLVRDYFDEKRIETDEDTGIVG